MDRRLQKVLVTGATGFLGAHIVRSLLTAGKTVVAAKRESSDPWRLDQVIEKVTTMDMDLTGPDTIGRSVALAEPDVIIHCAAYGVRFDEQDEHTAVAVNVDGSLELLKASAACGVERFVHIGSCFEYGDKDHPVREDEELKPTSMYALTKARASTLLLQSAEDLGVTLTVLRPFGLWGPLEAGYRLVPQIIDACINKKPLDLTGCEQIRDYTYITDMAGYITAIAFSEDFPVYPVVNLGSGKPVALKDFVLSVAEQLGAESLMRFGVLPYRSTEMCQVVADITRQRALLGEPIPAPFEQGVSATVAEIKQR